MEYRKLGRSGIDVSVICLGTMTYGQQNSELQGHEQMSYAVDQGVNFFDTAETYSAPMTRETQGESERIIGTWFKQTGRRDQVVLASKVTGACDFDYLREDGGPVFLSRAQIMEAVDKSLQRLRSDYIDLYQVHWPDRDVPVFGDHGLTYSHFMQSEHPFEEALRAFEELIQAGKVRFVGLSNETPWGVTQYLNLSEAHGVARVQSIQNAYSLVNRTFEAGLAEFAMCEDVGLLAYSPLAQGYLSGKYLDGNVPPGSRKTVFKDMQRYELAEAQRAIASYVALARGRGLDPAQMALQFVTSREFVTSTIIGTTTMEQLKIALGSIELDMNEELVEAINALHHHQPNPCP